MCIVKQKSTESFSIHSPVFSLPYSLVVSRFFFPPYLKEVSFLALFNAIRWHTLWGSLSLYLRMYGYGYTVRRGGG